MRFVSQFKIDLVILLTISISRVIRIQKTRGDIFQQNATNKNFDIVPYNDAIMGASQ